MTITSKWTTTRRDIVQSAPDPDEEDVTNIAAELLARQGRHLRNGEAWLSRGDIEIHVRAALFAQECARRLAEVEPPPGKFADFDIGGAARRGDEP